MSAYGLVLEAARQERRIKVSVYERGAGIEGTLRPYEDSPVSWDQVERGVSEITGLLNRANKRGKLSPEIFRSLTKAGQLLFDLLIPAKAREKLNASSAEELILHIDDKLVHIPWELLFNGREFLCRRFATGRVVSTSQVPTALAKRELKAPLKVLILADPRQDLKASYREGVEIRNLLDEASSEFEVDFKSAPIDVSFVKKNLRDYDVVHYAGHADYNPGKPAEGGWLLSDGRLKASEIPTMGGLQPMPFLVFSNACQSGQSGEWQVQDDYGEQIFGLANAHLMAGVQHYIGTFWEILDEPSSHFAKSFYGFLAQGEPVGAAVRKARERLIADFGEETIVWASYMLYGDPTFAFAAVKDTSAPETSARPAAASQWSDAMRSAPAAIAAHAEPRRSPRSYALFAVLAALTAIAGIAAITTDSLQRQPSTASLSEAIKPDADKPATSQADMANPLVAEAQAPKSSENSMAERTAELGPSSRSAVRQENNQTSEAAVVSTPATVSQANESQALSKAAAASVPVTPRITAAKPSVKTELALKTPPAAPVAPAPMTLSMNIIGQRKEPDGSYIEVLVNEGSVLRSYDNFQVHLQTNRAGHVYVLIYDSQGRASQLFPDPKIAQQGFVAAGNPVVIPAPDLWFWLDEHPGTETIYVLVSEAPMPDIQELLAKMETVDDSAKQEASQEIKRRVKIMQRGVGGITKGQVVTYRLTGGKKINKVTEVVSGTGVAVRTVSFRHK
jgi:CHAT domain-containing protein